MGHFSRTSVHLVPFLAVVLFIGQMLSRIGLRWTLFIACNAFMAMCQATNHIPQTLKPTLIHQTHEREIKRISHNRFGSELWPSGWWVKRCACANTQPQTFALNHFMISKHHVHLWDLYEEKKNAVESRYDSQTWGIIILRVIFFLFLFWHSSNYGIHPVHCAVNHQPTMRLNLSARL